MLSTCPPARPLPSCPPDRPLPPAAKVWNPASESTPQFPHRHPDTSVCKASPQPRPDQRKKGQEDECLPKSSPDTQTPHGVFGVFFFSSSRDSGAGRGLTGQDTPPPPDQQRRRPVTLAGPLDRGLPFPSITGPSQVRW